MKTEEGSMSRSITIPGGMGEDEWEEKREGSVGWKLVQKKRYILR